MQGLKADARLLRSDTTARMVITKAAVNDDTVAEVMSSIFLKTRWVPHFRATLASSKIRSRKKLSRESSQI